MTINYCTIGVCENPNPNPSVPALNGSPLEHLVFVGVVWTNGVLPVVPSQASTLYLGGIIVRASTLNTDAVLYLGHKFSATVITDNVTSGILTGELNGQVGKTVTDPKISLALTWQDVYSTKPLPFKFVLPPTATQIPLTLPQPGGQDTVTHLNIPIVWT